MTRRDLISTNGSAAGSKAGLPAPVHHLVAFLARLFTRERPGEPTLRVVGRQALTPAHTMFVVCCDAQRFIAVAHPTGVALWPLPPDNDVTEESARLASGSRANELPACSS